MGSGSSKNKSERTIDPAKAARVRRVNYYTGAAKAILADDAAAAATRAEAKVRADKAEKTYKNGKKRQTS